MPDDTAGTAVAEQTGEVAGEQAEVETDATATDTQQAQTDNPYDFDAPEAEDASEDTGAGEQGADTKGEDEEDSLAESGDEGAAPGEELEAPTLDAKLVARAEELGLTHDEVMGIGSDGVLEKVIMAMGDSAGQTKTAQTQEASEAAGTQEAAPGLKLELAEELFDPEVRGALETMQDHFNARIAQLEGRQEQTSGEVQGLVKTEDSRAEQEMLRWSDGKFAAMGAEYEGLFGKGERDSLAANSDALKNRGRVLQEMDVIADGRAQNGLPELSDDGLFTRAFNSEFGNEVQATVRKQIAGTLVKRKGTFTARATHRHGKDAMTPHDREVRDTAAFQEEHGIVVGGEDLAAGLPD